MSGQIADYKNIFLSGELEKDLELFKQIFKKDVILRTKRLRPKKASEYQYALVYMDGMVDSEQLNDAVIRPVLAIDSRENGSSAEYLETMVLTARDVKKANCVADILQSVLYGEALLLIDKSSYALTIDVKGWRTRGITEPQDERVLQGPREGFDEAAMLNLAMLRRKLQTPDLCIEMLRLGRRSNTLVFVCYLDSLSDPKTVNEVKKRIGKIDIDGILDSNYITEQIRNHKYSLFKTVGSTEKPDIVASKLLEGRIAVVVDGTPVVLTIPYLFSESFQSDEDYYINFTVASIGRFLRYLCFFLSVSAPAIFIALSVFHRELLPTSLAISILQLRAGVPFSPYTECLILLFIFEILKETGIRMSQNLGHTLSIVGGLVVGQAAVDARIISTPMLITVALSGIAGLMIPRLRSAVFYLRLLFATLAALFGFLGYTVGIAVTLMHIISLNSFGADYTLSLRRGDFQSLKDTVWRAPWEFMRERPFFNKNLVRMKRGNKK